MLERTKRIRYHSEIVLFHPRWSRSRPKCPGSGSETLPMIAFLSDPIFTGTGTGTNEDNPFISISRQFFRLSIQIFPRNWNQNRTYLKEANSACNASEYFDNELNVTYSLLYFSMLRSRNYLFSAPAPTLSIISAPAPPPATAIYCHIKLFDNSSTILIEVEISFSMS